MAESSIGASFELKKKLDKFKLSHNESYEQIIDRLLPPTLRITKTDGKIISCYLWNFPESEEPFMNIYSPKEKKNIIIQLSSIKKIEEIR